MTQVIWSADGCPVIVARRELWAAWFMTDPIARAMFGMGPDTGAPLPGVYPDVEAHVRRLRATARPVRE